MTRVVKYDILRVVASFSIVLLHVSASYWSVVDVHGREFLVMTIYNSFTRFAVPVFFMLSGLFLVSPDRDIAGLWKRIMKLLVLFYVWSAFYAFQGVAVDALGGEFSMEVWRASVERFIFGHVHMWFIQMLLGFYILIPVARQICAKKEIVKYYLKLNLIGITTVSFPAIISIPILTVFTFMVSLLGAFVIDHIPIVRKILMLH